MTATIHQLPTRPEPDAVIGNVQLYHCPTFSCLMTPATCKTNRQIASHTKKAPRKCPGAMREEVQATLARIKDREACLTCPGILALAREAQS